MYLQAALQAEAAVQDHPEAPPPDHREDGK
jgi:hypothetical protein